jgi:seryl-tRNA synthetase
MLDIKYIRQNKNKVAAAILNKGIKELSLDDFLLVDSQRTALNRRIEQHRSLRNELSSSISKITDKGGRDKLIEEARHVKEELQKMEKEFAVLDTQYKDTLLRIPNVPSEEMPVGAGEADNAVINVWLPDSGYIQEAVGSEYFDYTYMPETPAYYKDHVEIGKSLDIIDVEQSAKVSGSRFCYLKGDAVLLQEAVMALVKTRLRAMGYMPLMPPILVKEDALYGTSHFPEGKEDVYKIESFNVEAQNELYMVGSSEPANFSYFAGKTLKEEELPVKLYAQTTCFRSEVGSWGRDVRGIKRVHQFDKLEMNCVCKPPESRQVFDEFLQTNEWMLQQLKLPYRIVNKCTGDSGYNAAHLQYDFEYWRPPLKEFMEGGTSTIATDYQARRLNIRFKTDNGTGFVHTVNDTGVTTRVVVAILENYQQEDGSVVVPEALRDYVGKDKIFPKDEN